MSGKVTYVSVMAEESIQPAYEKALSEVWELLGRGWPIYIGGKEMYTSGKFEKRSPIDISIIGTFQRETPEEFKAALSRAVEAFPEWSRLERGRGFSLRCSVLLTPRLLPDGKRTFKLVKGNLIAGYALDLWKNFL